jgi:hypothetical protein
LTKKDILDGKNSPSQTASALALNVYRIPTVDGRKYMPGRDAIFHEPDGTFANVYPEHEIPAKPEQVLPRDKRNIERVKAHIAHLLKEPREQRLLLDWLSWVVQNPGKHVNFAVLLQGVPGDGKTFFGELMRACMGVSNVTMANAATITESAFTDFAYGQCLLCVEEVRIVGKSNGSDKWDAINRIKPFITNHIVEVHPKGGKPFNVVNTTSYLMFSNFKDALPLDDNDRRYMVFFSRWQRKEDLGAFNVEHPHYYERLYDALLESAGALRQWLLDHEQEASFNPKGVAPETTAKKVMIRKSQPEFIQVLNDLIERDETLEASRDLVDVTGLQDAMTAMGAHWPGPKALSAMMERDGYEAMGRVRLPNIGLHYFYSKVPDRFVSSSEKAGEYTDAKKIRDYLDDRANRLSDDL